MLDEKGVFFVAEKTDNLNKKLDVFYNPIMEHNRDVTLKILKKCNTDLKIGLPLAGSGVRALRIYKELNNKTDLYVNDVRSNFEKDLLTSIKKNKFDKNSFKIFNTEANIFLHKNKHFDYIDVDPFGSPNKFLDSSIQCLRNKGILAVTATDTGALAGTFKNACKRKYWATPLKNEFMHEFGLRILISKIQLVGCQHEKYLEPVLCYFKDHYYRIFFIMHSNRKTSERVFKERDYYKNHGPIYTGSLGKSSFLKDLEKDSFLEQVYEESKIDTIGYYDLHKRAEKLKMKTLPKSEELIELIKNKGYSACRTHFNPHGIRTDMEEKEFEELILQLS